MNSTNIGLFLNFLRWDRLIYNIAKYNILSATFLFVFFVFIWQFYGYTTAFALLFLESLLIWLCAKRPILALHFLVIAFALSPRFTSSYTSIEFYIRLDDLIIFAFIITTLQKIIVNKFNLIKTPLDNALLLFLLVVMLSILVGILSNTISEPLTSLFYLLKLMEYASVFYAAFYIIDSNEKLKSLFNTFLISAMALSTIGLIDWLFSYIIPNIGSTRPFRIFDNIIYKGESNHIAGFLVIAILLCVVSITNERQLTNKFRIAVVMFASVFTIFLTLSRISILTLFILLILFTVLTRKWLIVLSLILISLLCFILYKPAHQRLESIYWEYESFKYTLARTEVGYPPDFSYTRNRFENWSIALNEWRQFPLLGTGIGSRHRVFYENQYVMILAEIGIIGFVLFLWLLAKIIKNILSTFNSLPSTYKYGTFCIFFGVLLLGITSISLMISRIAGPFWLLVGAGIRQKQNYFLNSR